MVLSENPQEADKESSHPTIYNWMLFLAPLHLLFLP